MRKYTSVRIIYKPRNQSRVPHLGQIFIIRSLIQDFKLELHKVLNEQVQKAGNNLRSSRGSLMRSESAHAHARPSSALPSEAVVRLWKRHHTKGL